MASRIQVTPLAEECSPTLGSRNGLTAFWFGRLQVLEGKCYRRNHHALSIPLLLSPSGSLSGNEERAAANAFDRLDEGAGGAKACREEAGMKADMSSRELEDKVTRSETRSLRKLYNRANHKGKPIIDPNKLARERIRELKPRGTALTALAYITLLPLAREVCREANRAEHNKAERRLVRRSRKWPRAAREKPTIYSHRRRV